MSARPNFFNFEILWHRNAKKDFDALPARIQSSVLKRIDNLLVSSENLDIKKLKSKSKLYRIRDGNYRIIFKSDDSKRLITIVTIAHRKSVYKSLKKLDIMMLGVG